MSRCKACNKMGATYIERLENFITEERTVVEDHPVMDTSPFFKDNVSFIRKDRMSGEYYCRDCWSSIEVASRNPNITGPRYPVVRISYEQLIAEMPRYAQYPQHPEFGRTEIKSPVIPPLDDDLFIDPWFEGDELAEEAHSKTNDNRPIRIVLFGTSGGGYRKVPRFEE